MRNSIAETTEHTIFAPEIFSIEGFIEHVATLSYATNTEQLFALYESYRATRKGETDSFYAFSKWAQTVLQDFNEIDRYLIDTERLFANLSAVQEISIWSPEAKKTRMMEDYLSFWKQLPGLYRHFNENLLRQHIGHQGLIYRTACEKLTEYLERSPDQRHIFVGFNALNTAESQIIQTILGNDRGEIFWDIDRSFVEDPIHDAGLFIRQHLREWPYLKEHGINGLSAHYSDSKDIEIIGIPKNVSQAKYVGQLLKQMHDERPAQLKRTAVVLGEESLLNPIINAVPLEIPDVNITMGYPLDKSPLAALFQQFFALYLHRDEQGWFHKPLLDFLSHPYLQLLFSAEKTNWATELSIEIKKRNWAYVNVRQLLRSTQEHEYVAFLFFDAPPTPSLMLEKCIGLITLLKERANLDAHPLSLEYLYRFYTLFIQLDGLLKKHGFLTDLRSLISLYQELLSAETLDFQGEPLRGLQIMGMLESRNLDFETVILTSVNEGILPSGKSNNSFIPFDLKKYFGLPTYKEKDAVYTYHFYRLLQRAKKVYILYNTEPDVLEGGEPSRLIRQLLTDDLRSSDVSSALATPHIAPTPYRLETIAKDHGLMALIREHAAKGFSPTSLSNYIRDPLQFYKRHLLRIDDSLEVEETIAANTFGTIVHDTLEELYQPFIGTDLTVPGLQTARANAKETVHKHFKKTYLEGDITRGKNLIAYQVVIRYIENFFDKEIETVQKHQVHLVALEQNLNITLDLKAIPFPVILKGKLDRVDRMDGRLRIIDYKTGKVTAAQVEIFDWDLLVTEYDYSKAFQLLCYALMYDGSHLSEPLTAGIVSFKNLGAGVLGFATKEKKGGRTKNGVIDDEVLATFKDRLAALISEICHPEIPFQEKLLL